MFVFEVFCYILQSCSRLYSMVLSNSDKGYIYYFSKKLIILYILASYSFLSDTDLSF